MQLHCRYHPTRHPVLVCTQCATTVCPDCVPVWPERGNPRCVNCRSEMETLGIADYIPPFWRCFDQFFQFPFLKENLIFLSITLLISLILPLPQASNSGENVVHSGVFFTLISWLFYLSFVLAYLAAVTIAGAEGQKKPPSLSKIWRSGGLSMFFKFLGTLWLFGFYAGMVSILFGTVLESIFYMVGALVFPAVMMLLVMEKSVITALNPSKLLMVMRSIGWPYVFLWGMMVMLVSGPGLVLELFSPFEFGGWILRIGLLVNIIFGLILFYLMGYVIYQYHYELGYMLPKQQMSELQNNSRHSNPVLIEMELLVADGKYHSAIRLLEAALRENSNQQILWEKLLVLSELTESPQNLLKMAQIYMGHLERKQQFTEIAKVIKRLLRAKNDLRLEDFASPQKVTDMLTLQQEFDLLKKLS